jgi:hypothetical protein
VKLVAYSNLTNKQKQAVRAHFGDPTIDEFEKWVKEKAFYITARGRLSRRYSHAMPVWMAKVEAESDQGGR